MRIYVCTSEDVYSDSKIQEKIRVQLHDSLKRFYGPFPQTDIEFFRSDKAMTIYFMEEASFGDDCAITQAIKGVLQNKVNVMLNYQRVAPNFRPVEPKTVPVKFKYPAEKPLYTFDQLVLPDKTRKKLLEAISMILPEVRHKVFHEWGLKHIIPYAASALSLYGPPGTGKSMAAEAIAHKLGKNIIRASYADITSKYFGEGSKMVNIIFECAKLQDAVLFIDEADALLSKRLTDVTDGSGNAINAMRSQLLLSLERIEGIAIFATNLVVNYDKAFISRLISIEIPPPDFQGRKAIWEQHIRGERINIPLANDVSIEELAKRYDTFCGREIKKSVIRACTAAVVEGNGTVTQKDFLTACQKIQTEARELARASDYTQQNVSRLTPILTPFFR